MPTITITSNKLANGFPDDTEIRIEWVSGQRVLRDRKRGTSRLKYKERRLVWTGVVSGEVTRSFDYGKYVWKAHKYTESGLDNFSELGEFLVGMNEKQWAKVSHMRPKVAQARMTTDGVVFSCGFPGCDKKTTSRIAAVLHETEVHYGVNLLESENPDSEKDNVDKQIEQVVQKRGPGRPKKFPQETN